MGELANCPKCGALFVQTVRKICQNCYNEEEKAFDIVYKFMRKRVNRQATIPEIVEGTGVEEELIIKFVKEKRLRTSEFPSLSYPCEKCGKNITEGRLCHSCSNEIVSDLKLHEEIERVAERNGSGRNGKDKTYFNYDSSEKNS